MTDQLPGEPDYYHIAAFNDNGRGLPYRRFGPVTPDAAELETVNVLATIDGRFPGRLAFRRNVYASKLREDLERIDDGPRLAVHPGSGNIHALRPQKSLLQIGTDGPPTCYCGRRPKNREWADIGRDSEELDYEGCAEGCLDQAGGLL